MEMTMLHPEMITERSRKLIERAAPVFEAGVSARVIRNVDYKDAWDRFSRAYDEERDEVRHPRDGISPRYNDGKHSEDVCRAYYEVTDVLGQLTHLGSAKKKLAILDAAPEASDRPPIVREARARVEKLIERWMPIVETARELKPLIVKGRAPSTEPPKTPPRTLENTGTCACCNQNVKLTGAMTMVDHGFTIKWNERNGKCLGVGQPPVEISPDGLHAVVRVFTSQVEAARKRLAIAIDPGHDTYASSIRRGESRPVGRDEPEYERLRRNFIAHAESDIRHGEYVIADFTKRIENWEEQPLPGESLGAGMKI